jgi:hypothetical protein
MTSNEFVIWLKGFVKAANTYNITPKQWEAICEELDKVYIEENKTKITNYTSNNSSWSVFNNPEKHNSTITCGRPEDSITYTND